MSSLLVVLRGDSRTLRDSLAASARCAQALAPPTDRGGAPRASLGRRSTSRGGRAARGVPHGVRPRRRHRHGAVARRPARARHRPQRQSLGVTRSARRRGHPSRDPHPCRRRLPGTGAQSNARGAGERGPSGGPQPERRPAAGPGHRAGGAPRSRLAPGHTASARRGGRGQLGSGRSTRHAQPLATGPRVSVGGRRDRRRGDQAVAEVLSRLPRARRRPAPRFRPDAGGSWRQLF